MDALAILESLEAAKGKKAKVQILKDNKDNPQLLDLLDAALNFKRKFHMKKFDETGSTEEPGEFDLHITFTTLLNTLETRHITGNAAIEEVESFFRTCNELQRKWYARVLRKNLRCGFDVSSCGKAGINIETFDVMLAKNGKDYKKAPQLVEKGVFLSPKFDGYRCIAICNYGDVQLFSRNGTEYHNFPKVKEELSKWCATSKFVLDGEIMSSDFNAMQSLAFGSISKKGVTDSEYHVFGYIDFDEWESEDFKQPTTQRLNELTMLFSNNALVRQGNVIEVKQILVNNIDEILKYEQQWLAAGYEGAMALPADIPYYKGKKTGRLMKFKTFESMDCKVVEVYEGEKHTKYEGMLGGVTVLQEDGQRCDCGSGFTDDERKDIWADPGSVIGRTIECAYQELTPDNIMRFPTKKKWRPDKD
jgi:DNA ligase-1